MEQRPLRLGDIVDDYCARERRVTNHAVVALVGDAIRQTRCTTCDTEHPYKGAKEPRLRKKPGTSELYDRVLADVNGNAAPESREEAGSSESGAEPLAADAAGPNNEAESNGSPGETSGPEEAWSAHRRLIRATLPKTENEPPIPRPIPEFTMYQRPQPRGGRFRFRGGQGSGHGEANGNGNGNGNGGHGFGHGHGGHSGTPGRHHRGKKRPR